MKILHIVPGLNDPTCGIAVAANLLAKSQRSTGHDVQLESSCFTKKYFTSDLIYVHSMWTPTVIIASIFALVVNKRFVRMIHANLDPVRLCYRQWKKQLVKPIEKWLLKRAETIVATCRSEEEWIRLYEPQVKSIEVIDIMCCFDFKKPEPLKRLMYEKKMNLLYLGRLHPLKGVVYLEEAVKMFNKNNSIKLDLRVENNVCGEEKDKVWAWCDVLVLPTLSENFGLVVAEALEHGKRVITTDGAPAWESFENENEKQKQLIYIKGFRDGTDEQRVQLLAESFKIMCIPG